jgi:hypothetical protein
VPLLEAVAKQTDSTLIISDEAREKLKGVELAGEIINKLKPLEFLLSVFSRSGRTNEYDRRTRVVVHFDDSNRLKPLAVRVGMLDSISWGKVGANTYLVVPRNESQADIEARKAEVELTEQEREKLSEEALKRRQQTPENSPEDNTLGAKVWLLTPEQQ